MKNDPTDINPETEGLVQLGSLTDGVPYTEEYAQASTDGAEVTTRSGDTTIYWATPEIVKRNWSNEQKQESK